MITKKKVNMIHLIKESDKGLKEKIRKREDVKESSLNLFEALSFEQTPGTYTVIM